MKRLLILLALLALTLAIFVIADKKSSDLPHSPDTPPSIDTTLQKETPITPEDPVSSDIEKAPLDESRVPLRPQKIMLHGGESFELFLAEGFKIYPAMEGLRRVRFFAKAPDGRLFVTGMHALYDNKKGKVFILDEFNIATKKFEKLDIWKDNLRNPNSVQFYQDESGKDWLYLATTDSLVRYPFQHGEVKPSGEPQKIADFPGDGLNYKYGGWHLTRTIAIHDHKIYVSAGSSCNLCEEKINEPSRAAILVMNPDGSDLKIFAKGVRNAVDIGWVEGKLFGTNMAADHLGWAKPNDTFHEFREGKHYGFPYCYENEGVIYEEDPKHQSDNKVAGKIIKDSWSRKMINCDEVPHAYTLFESHGSPLGFEYFGDKTASPILRNYFVAALHGPTKPKKDMNIGHRLVRFKKDHYPEPILDGFFQNGQQFGRPCDIFQWDEKSFFLSDDHKGVVYFITNEDSI